MLLVRRLCPRNQAFRHTFFSDNFLQTVKQNESQEFHDQRFTCSPVRYKLHPYIEIDQPAIWKPRQKKILARSTCTTSQPGDNSSREVANTLWLRAVNIVKALTLSMPDIFTQKNSLKSSMFLGCGVKTA